MTKPLKPTLRERNRYVAFEVAGDGKPGREDVIRATTGIILKTYGTEGAGRINPWLCEFDGKTGRGILKVSHKSVGEARAALTLITEVAGVKVAVRTLGVSGTIKRAREKWIKG